MLVSGDVGYAGYGCSLASLPISAAMQSFATNHTTLQPALCNLHYVAGIMQIIRAYRS